MYTKILLVIVIIVLSAFFYLHAQNPGTVTFVITNEHTYVMPSTLLLFSGFFAGVVLAVLNSLLVDARRAIREMNARKERKLNAQAEENYRKGNELLVKGDTAGARELFEKSLKAKPADTGLIISLAETYSRENRHKEALKILENGFLNNPSSIGVLSSLARCAADSGDTFRAAKALDEVVRLDPRNLYALKKLRDFKLKDGLWAEAAILQKSIADSEQESSAKKREKRLLTGVLFEAASRHINDGSLNDAVARLKDALKNDDSFVPAHILLGEALERQGNTAGAIKVWEKALLKHPASEAVMLKLEDACIKESAPEKILERYKKEIISRPNDVNLRLLLARLYLRLEMVDNAMEELERLHNEGEDSGFTQILLGEAYLRRKQGGKAAHLFARALGLDRDFSPPFVCTACSGESRPWKARCPSCGEWNTLVMNTTAAAARLGAVKRQG